jgi:hypothetical protein
MVIAQRFPRDEVRAEQKIVDACKRKKLAEQAEYAYPRGGQTVTGPSIRLAELAGRHWGNLSYGVRELEQRHDGSEMEAYCHDLETNTRAVRQFFVPNKRKARGTYQQLDDPRDIYEHNANMGARRLRAVILEIIPGDVVESAIEQCHKTLQGSSDMPLIDRIKNMVAAFSELGVSQEQIEKRQGKKVSAMLEVELVNLRKVYNSIKDGMSKPDAWFGDTTETLKERLQKVTKGGPPIGEPEPDPEPEVEIEKPQPQPDPALEDGDDYPFDGKGRFSQGEDNWIDARQADMISEAQQTGVPSDEAIDRAFNTQPYGGGTTKASSIRSRDKRKAWLRHCEYLLEGWVNDTVTPQPRVEDTGLFDE